MSQRGEIPKLRKAARDQYCIKCNAHDGTIVGAHYTGARRLAYGGGFGLKAHDLMVAHLCFKCHEWMDKKMRAAGKDEDLQWKHSEEFQHLILLTILRLYNQGFLVVGNGDEE